MADVVALVLGQAFEEQRHAFLHILGCSDLLHDVEAHVVARALEALAEQRRIAFLRARSDLRLVGDNDAVNALEDVVLERFGDDEVAGAESWVK